MNNDKVGMYVFGCIMFLGGLFGFAFSIAIHSQGLALKSVGLIIVGISITNAIEYRNDPCSFWKRLGKKFKRKKTAQTINPAGVFMKDCK